MSIFGMLIKDAEPAVTFDDVKIELKSNLTVLAIFVSATSFCFEARVNKKSRMIPPTMIIKIQFSCMSITALDINRHLPSYPILTGKYN